jgi:hypothetical protein
MNELPDHLSLLNKKGMDENETFQHNAFQHNAFKDLSIFLYNCPEDIRRTDNHFTFRYESLSCNNITYLIYRIRDNPERLINLKYFKYTFELKIEDGGDLYKLTITEPASGFKSLYSEKIDSFD